MADLGSKDINLISEHPLVEIAASVNGRKVSRLVPNHYRLIDFVREELALTGNKEGCGAGECGTCSMFVDGVLVKSCLMMRSLLKIQQLASIRTRNAARKSNTSLPNFYGTIQVVTMSSSFHNGLNSGNQFKMMTVPRIQRTAT